MIGCDYITLCQKYKAAAFSDSLLQYLEKYGERVVTPFFHYIVEDSQILLATDRNANRVRLIS